MASSDIVIRYEARPCKVDGLRNALWHSFYNGKAIVEFADGTVQKVYTDRVRFMDTKQRFLEYNWEEDDDRR